jgi:peptidoglycan/LPS O-acetylase OafA/YrhL
LPALTGIRCFAALNLVLFHFTPPAHVLGPLSPIVDGGYVSVSFFLLLSGFILTYNYAERASQGQLRAWKFWQARFSRLYPVYIFSLLISVGMLIREFHAQTRLNFILGMVMTPLLIQGWHPRLTTFWNTPAWTMSTEAFFYILFPWLLTVRRPSRGKSLLCLMAGIWICSFILPLLYIYFNPDGDHHINRYSSGVWLRALKFMPIQHVPSFLFGMALAFLNEKIPAASRKRLAAGVVGFVSVYLILCFADRIPYVLLHDGLLMPLFAAIILCLAGRNSLSRIFGILPFMVIGEASYCLYLLHFNLWNMLHRSQLLEKSGLAIFDPWISYLLVIIAALLTKRLIEKPARSWITRRMQPSGKLKENHG